jgi:hypothetical protein
VTRRKPPSRYHSFEIFHAAQNRPQGSAQNSAVEDVSPAAQVSSVGENDCQTSQDPDFALRAGIPEPAPRAEKSGGIGHGAAIEKRTELHSEETVLIDVFVKLPIGKKKSAAERSRTFAAVKSSGMAAKP